MYCLKPTFVALKYRQAVFNSGCAFGIGTYNDTETQKVLEFLESLGVTDLKLIFSGRSSDEMTVHGSTCKDDMNLIKIITPPTPIEKIPMFESMFIIIENLNYQKN